MSHEQKQQPVVGFSLDFDGCAAILAGIYAQDNLTRLFDADKVQTARSLFAASLGKRAPDEKTKCLFIGSSRQAEHIERALSQNTKGIRAYELNGMIAADGNWLIPATVEPYSGYGDPQSGWRSFSEDWMGVFYVGDNDSILNKWDRLRKEDLGLEKACFLILQLKRFAEQMPSSQGEADFYFVDDRSDILRSVSQYFKNNPHKIPDKVKLHICQFNLTEEIQKEHAENEDVIHEWCVLTNRPVYYGCCFFRRNTTNIIRLQRLSTLTIPAVMLLGTYLAWQYGNMQDAKTLWKNMFHTPNGVTIGSVCAIALVAMIAFYLLLRYTNPVLYKPSESRYAALFAEGLSFPSERG